MNATDPPPGSAAGGWDLFQVTYWDSIASHYGSLYASAWSRRENGVVRRRLADLVEDDWAGIVLDLGCGRGLGYELLQRNGRGTNYVGVDVSFQMLARAAAPKGQVAQQAMDKLGVADGSVATLLALFSSASYAEDLSSLLGETARVLRTGGVAYLSFLSRSALSRAGGFAATSTYRTRGDRRSWAYAPAHRVGARHVRRLVNQAGLVVESASGINALSGVVEADLLWRPGRALARLLPSLSHTLEFTLRKP